MLWDLLLIDSLIFLVRKICSCASDFVFEYVLKSDKNRKYSRDILTKRFSPEFRDLVSRMLANKPQRRATITEIRQHPWLLGGVEPTHEQLRQ